MANGSTTFRNQEKQRGLEPDECYCRGADRETPDLAIEVVVTTPAIDKLEVYRGLGVGEVWMFEAGAFRILALRSGDYVPIAASDVFPELDLSRVARHVAQGDQHEAPRAYRDELRRRA